jgi:D-glycero-alpha-D-manno-heptose 1-phosphate guanylyltransferase
LQAHSFSFEIAWVIEEEPLGTGGGIALALEAANEENVFVLNGDTFFDVPLSSMYEKHIANPASETTIALKYLEQFDRYGTVTMNTEQYITAFHEKKYCEAGLINGGIYLINKHKFAAKGLPNKFSFEKEYLEPSVCKQQIQGFECEGYFIDIGIPVDYEKVQIDFQQLFA